MAPIVPKAPRADKKRKAAQLLDDEAGEDDDDETSSVATGGTDVDGDGLDRVFDLSEHWSVDIETSMAQSLVVRQRVLSSTPP